MVDIDGVVKSVVEDLLFFNVFVISKDGKFLFVVEIFGLGFFKYDVGFGGELLNKIIFWLLIFLFDYIDKDGVGLMVKIDGGCIDDDDNIWLFMLGYE